MDKDYNKTEDIAQGQLVAYNDQDIEEFLKFYTEDVEVFNFPDEFLYKGKENMREKYKAAWQQNPLQKAEVTERISLKDTVIDKEYVTGRADGSTANVIAVYKIKESCICKVYFIRG